MKTKRYERSLFIPQTGRYATVLNWHNAPVRELARYAQAFREAANTLVQQWSLDESPRTDWNACPVVFLYRHAAELYLKGLVLGDGANFLESPPDHASVLRTHSLNRLFTFVRDMFRAVGWNGNLGNGPIKTVRDLENMIRELDAVDPGSYTFRYPVNKEGGASVEDHFNFSAVEFAQRMDAVLDILETADSGLTAIWDQRAEAVALAAEREQRE
jgi:hypothetical protein